MEFVVYLSTLGQEVNKLQILSGMEIKDTIESIRQILFYLFQHYLQVIQEVPENDTRGIDEHA